MEIAHACKMLNLMAVIIHLISKAMLLRRVQTLTANQGELCTNSSKIKRNMPRRRQRRRLAHLKKGLRISQASFQEDLRLTRKVSRWPEEDVERRAQMKVGLMETRNRLMLRVKDHANQRVLQDRHSLSTIGSISCTKIK